MSKNEAKMLEFIRENMTYHAGVFRWKDGKRTNQRADESLCDGYRVVSAKIDGKRIQVRAHRMMWILANGDLKEGSNLIHLNDDITDNRPENLQLSAYDPLYDYDE